ncbi:MAG: DUF11 domain-containing protein [Caldilineaceae bacterium]|nr:DUF11 domain-containing protein [Caldilineaceae bacterium]
MLQIYSPAVAYAQSAPFACDGTIFISQGDSTSSTLFSVDSGTNPFTLNALSPTERFQYNAIGFNVIDGLLYGIVRSDDRPRVASGDIIAIDANSNVINFGRPDVATTSVTGDIDERGIFYVADGSKLYAYDTQAPNFPNIMAGYPKTFSTPASVGSDFAYNPSDGFLYGFRGGKIIRINPATAQTTYLALTGDQPTASTFGAMWFDARGALFGYQNNLGIYRIDVNTFVSKYVSSAAHVSTNDGAGCAYAPILEKTVSQEQVIPGAVVRYQFVIVNGFRRSVMPLGFTDTLPAGFTYVDNTLTIQGASANGVVNAYGGSDTLTISGLQIPAAGAITMQVDVQVSFDVSSGIYRNQAYLTDLYPSLGGTLPSDWPVSTEAGDPTPLKVVAQADITLTKRFLHNQDEDGNGALSAGDTIRYEFVGANSGAVRLRNVQIVDPLPNLGPLSCTPLQPAILLPGEQIRCLADYVITQDDINRGHIDNMAQAVGTDAAGVTVNDSAAASIVLAQQPSIALAKTLAHNADEDGSGTVTLADTLTYQFNVINNGNVTLFDVDVTDPLPGLGALNCNTALPATLAPNGAFTCTAQYVVTLDDVDMGEIENSATATGTDAASNPISDSDSHLVVSSADPSVELTKTLLSNADEDGSHSVSVGDLLTYQFVVNNDGNVSLQNVIITDPLAGLSALACAPGLGADLAPNAQMVCTATYRVTQADVDKGKINNQATVRAQPTQGAALEDKSTLTLSLPQIPAIKLAKNLAHNADQDRSGAITLHDQLTYEFLSTNSGNVTLANVTIADPLPGLSALSCVPTQPANLPPKSQLRCTATYNVTQSDVDNGFVDNTATTAGVAPSHTSVNDAQRLQLEVVQESSISLDKELVDNADEDGSGDVSLNDTLSYQFDVENTGSVTLKNVHVVDTLVDMTSAQCTPTSPATLAPGGKMVCTVTYAVRQPDIDSGLVVNRAVATGEAPNGTTEEDRDVAGAQVNQTAAIALSKSVTMTVDADGSHNVSRSDTLTYQFVAQNSGNVTLRSVEISDPLSGLSALTCAPAQPATLAPAATIACQATYIVEQADVDHGIVHNEARVIAHDPADKAITTTAAADIVVEQMPSIRLTKYLLSNADEDGSGSISPGDTITYRFDVVNDGNITLHNVTVSDPLPGLSNITCTPSQPASLGEDDEMRCTATYQIQNGDLAEPGLSNTATAHALDPKGNALSDGDGELVPPSSVPAMELFKSWIANADEDGNGLPTLNDTLTYQFVITNSGGETLRNVDLSDPLPGLSAFTCAHPLPATVRATESITCTATYGVMQADADRGYIANTATASAIDVSNNPLTDASLETVPIPQRLAVEIDKTLLANTDEDGSADVSVGDTLTYQIVATNTGYLSLADVIIVDPLPGLGAFTCGVQLPTTLNYTEAITCTATYAVNQADIDAGQISNMASITGTSPYAETVTESATLLIETAIQRPVLELVKALAQNTDGDNSSSITLGDLLTYTFAATNTGNVTLTDVEIYDAKAGLSPLACGSAFPVTLAPQEGVQCTAAYTVTQVDMDSGLVANSAIVTGQDPAGRSVESESSVQAATELAPAIELTKEAIVNRFVQAGDPITYTFVVTNVGNVTLDNVQISDPLEGLSALVCIPAQPATLAPQALLRCTATYPVLLADIDAGALTNRAVVAAIDPAGGAISATDTHIATIAQYPQLTLSKTVSPTTPVHVGDVVTFTMVATNIGNSTIRDVVITDELSGLSPLQCIPEQPAILAPGETLTCVATYVAPAPQSH